MKVEIWSDFISPLCYIGKRQFELALEQFQYRQFVKVEYKSYPLGKCADCNDMRLEDLLIEKYGVQSDEVNNWKNTIEQHAKQLQIPIPLERLTQTNTVDAHRLVKYAEKHGKALQVVDALFEHYFSKCENIGNKETLISIAQNVGLNEKEVTELLSIEKYTKSVQYDKEEAEEIGIAEVPFFIINEKYALYGLPSVKVLLEALQESWQEDEARLLKKAQSENVTLFCVGDECEAEEVKK